MPERAGRETPFLEAAGSKPIRRKVLLLRGFFLFFAFFKATFCRVLACRIQVFTIFYAIIPNMKNVN